MTFYIKGLFVGLGSVALFYVALRLFLLAPGSRIGNIILYPVYLLIFLFRNPNPSLGAVAGGSNLLLQL